MQRPIEDYSDAELLAIIREGGNINVPGGLYQRANSEWQIRQHNKLVEATKNGKGGIFFEVGGDMKNDGVIHTGEGATVDIAVAGNYTSNKGKIIQGDRKDDAHTADDEELFKAEAPKTVGNLVWFYKLFNLKLGLRNHPRWRKFIIFLLIAIGVIALIKIYFSVMNPGYFTYQPIETAYNAETSTPTMLDALFMANVKNISSESRYLETFHYVLWRDKWVDRSWDYGYGVGTVYLVDGQTFTTTTLPILFQPNESKELAWKVQIDISDPAIDAAYAQQQCAGVFCWAKNTPDLLTEDSRGNVYEGDGELASQAVIDDWWVFPNNRTFTQQALATPELAFQIIKWWIERFLPLPK